MVSSSSRLMKDQRRETIRQAALKKMLEYSIESVSIRSIAKEAKISETLLYRYYKGKYAILYDLFLTEFSRISEKVEELIDTMVVMVTDLEVALPTIGKFLKKILGENQDLLLLVIREEEKINTFLEKGRSKLRIADSEKLEIMIQQFLNPKTAAVLTDYFKRCKSEGNLKKELDPEVCSMMVVTIIWQTILKNPYKYLHPNINDQYFEYLLDTQLKILIDAMKPKQ
ncbi:MAG: TetR/AcrR family transcriptional regulator [Candidatus Heimdallarchaeota archaeon]|nr:TetR/AcrR family transcriptional regulator [Candidatus Heimdallarchaeota archaeon]MCK5142371.1 TetR/AcrR family transcriptional regulator [Candidatus Heimdallarchaeota archaeon]